MRRPNTKPAEKQVGIPPTNYDKIPSFVDGIRYDKELLDAEKQSKREEELKNNPKSRMQNAYKNASGRKDDVFGSKKLKKN